MMLLNPHIFCFDRSPLHAAIWYASGSGTAGTGGGGVRGGGASPPPTTGVGGFVGSPH